MKVLIVGAGIAGNALAFWLSKVGHEVTVIEQFPVLRSSGLQIDLRGHGVEVMKLMGVEKAFREKSIDEKGIQIVDSSGKQWAFFPVNKTGKGLQSMSTEHEIMRGDLCRLLHSATEERATFLFGKSIQTMTQHEDSVQVSFRDGTKGAFDLVVGADGQGSRTRREMSRPDATDKRTFGDTTVAYFTIPRPVQPGELYMVTMYMATDSRLVMTRRHVADAVQVYLFCKATREEVVDARSHPIQAQKEAFASVFRDAGWQMEEITDAMLQHSDDFYYERQAYVKLESWFRGSVTLCGDACWASSSNTGMGTTSALVGAYVLAGEISRHCKDGDKANLSLALRSYEKTFKPFVRQVQRDLEKGKGSLNLPTSWLGITMMNAALGVLSYFRVNIFGWILKEDIRDWELPLYEDLLKDGEQSRTHMANS